MDTTPGSDAALDLSASLTDTPDTLKLVDLLQKLPTSTLRLSFWSFLSPLARHNFRLVCSEARKLADELLTASLCIRPTEHQEHQRYGVVGQAWLASCAAIQQAGGTILNKFAAVESLTLDWSGYDTINSDRVEHQQRMHNVIGTCSNLTRLCLRWCEFYHNSLHLVADSFTNLKSLEISSDFLYLPEEAILLSESLRALTALSSLQKLNLQTCYYMNHEVLQDLACLTQVQDLMPPILCYYAQDMKEAGFWQPNDEAVGAMLRALTGLTALALVCYGLYQAPMDRLPSACLTGTTNLQRLHLEETRGCWAENKDRSDLLLATAEAIPSMIELTLKSHYIGGDDGSFLRLHALLELGSLTPVLAQLDTYAIIACPASRRMVTLGVKNTSITNLNVSYDGYDWAFPEGGVAELSLILQALPNLRYLSTHLVLWPGELLAANDSCMIGLVAETSSMSTNDQQSSADQCLTEAASESNKGCCITQAGLRDEGPVIQGDQSMDSSRFTHHDGRSHDVHGHGSHSYHAGLSLLWQGCRKDMRLALTVHSKFENHQRAEQEAAVDALLDGLIAHNDSVVSLHMGRNVLTRDDWEVGGVNRRLWGKICAGLSGLKSLSVRLCEPMNAAALANMTGLRHVEAVRLYGDYQGAGTLDFYAGLVACMPKAQTVVMQWLEDSLLERINARLQQTGCSCSVSKL